MDGFVGLGSNLGDRRENLARGLAGLKSAGLTLVAMSSVWETEPVDAPSSRWFWNMVVKLSTALDPFEVLDRLLNVERDAGRERGVRNAPRTLDLDLLLLGRWVVRHPRLELPHPRMWQRRFVLDPLVELEPQLVNPATGRTAAEERDRLRDGPRVRRLGSLASRGDEPV
jgi:2-amino-4-hydroxy-6-hydroxymethyldihydropteridine diphosphokinase